MFCKIKEALVLEILNNCFEADVLKSIGRQTEWLHNQKSKKKKRQTNVFFSFLFSNHFSILVYPPLVV